MASGVRPKLGLQARQVQQLVGLAEAEGDQEQCALLAVGRLCLLRMPSECLPLQIAGDHSEVSIEADTLTII